MNGIPKEGGLVCLVLCTFYAFTFLQKKTISGLVVVSWCAVGTTRYTLVWTVCHGMKEKPFVIPSFYLTSNCSAQQAKGD